MNLEKVHKVVSAIKTRLFKRSNSLSIGMLKSNVKGTGLQFKDFQVYSPGDDIRFLDWKLLARTGTPYVKLYEEERNVEVVYIIDFSPSMLYGDNGISKLQAILEICCLLILLVKETQDKLRFIFLCDKPINIYPLVGEKGVAKLIAELVRIGLMTEKGNLNLDFRTEVIMSDLEKREYFKKYVGRQREVIFFTDAVDKEIEKELEFLKTKRSHLFKIISPLDYQDIFKFNILGSKYSKGGIQNSFFKPTYNKNDSLKNSSKIKIIKLEENYLEKFIKCFA